MRAIFIVEHGVDKRAIDDKISRNKSEIKRVTWYFIKCDRGDKVHGHTMPRSRKLLLVGGFSNFTLGNESLHCVEMNYKKKQIGFQALMN